MKHYLFGLIAAIAGISLNGETIQYNIYRPSSEYTAPGQHIFIFVIDLEYRDKKSQVENLQNWRCLGEYANRSVLCTAGGDQACQIIVDERDTYLHASKKVRLLNTAIIITAIPNASSSHWIVDNFISTNSYRFFIINEGK